MPPYKKPMTLEKVCMNAVATLVLNACTNVEKKYGNVDEEMSRCKLKILQGYLVTKIRPLFDELCRVVLEVYCCRYSVRNATILVRKECLSTDIRGLLRVTSCEHTKSLNLGGIARGTDLKFVNGDLFFTNQISKLKNVVRLDFGRVILTDGMFEGVSRVCRNVREISLRSNLEFSSRDSVYKLLACEKMEIVKIVFVNWTEKREVVACVRGFVRNLTRLRHIDFDEMGSVLVSGAKRTTTTTTTTLWRLTDKCVNSESLRAIVELCPSLVELNIGAQYSSQHEQDEMFDILTESCLGLQTLELHRFSFTQEMSRFLKVKGKHLLKLRLCLNAGTITYNDVCTVGANCPKLEQLEIEEMFTIVSPNFHGVAKFQNQTRNISSRLFVNLKRLVLKCDSKWDRRILPLVLNNAKNLDSISLTNAFPKRVDAIAETINANPLTELKSFKLVTERHGSEMAVHGLEQSSIRRLVDSCSKLTSLELVCGFDDGAIRYLEDLERRIRDENLDLKLSYTHVKYGLNICDGGAPREYVLYEEY